MKRLGRLILIIAVVAISLVGISTFNMLTASQPPLGHWMRYEYWASDQSNSVPGQASLGIKGSYLWIWDSADVDRQLAGGSTAQPIACGSNSTGKNPFNRGPCNLLDVFPSSLMEVDGSGNPTGNKLADLPGFGRLHGMLSDPQNRYVNANIFAPGGGYVGVIDTRTKEAIALFRVTSTNFPSVSNARSVHMSFWNNDGSAILIANLNGKVLERIDVTRSRSGKIKNLTFNKAASLGVGKGMQVQSEATTFIGRNARGRKLIGTVANAYSINAFSDLTPNGICKENGCGSGKDGAAGGRPNNLIVCPILSQNRKAYVTMAGGGLLVADTDATPMQIVGEYGNQSINGAGCGGVETGNTVWLNAGVSTSAAGASQSTFTVYTLDDRQFSKTPNLENVPAPVEVFKDPSNTATNGNLTGEAQNLTGQLPGKTTRRDSHGMVATLDGRYVHTVDRIRNIVEVFDAQTKVRSTYSLTGTDGNNPCLVTSVSDDLNLPKNDPSLDLLEATPDGKYLAIAFRGPAPVSVDHSAQGSCPGVGIVELTNSGASGRLVGVLRSTNTVDTAPPNVPGGHPYTGAERSDVHGITIVRKFPRFPGFYK
jgi:hypothetical protein